MMKLSAKQNFIVYAMQQGWELIAQHTETEITCCSKDGQFLFSRTIFFNLCDKGLIRQQSVYPFEWKLTKEGHEIKTKPVDLSVTL